MKLLIQETVLRIFSTDLTKGFDFIHHSILLDELRSFNIDQTPFFWIRFFLTNRPYIQVIYANQSLSPENITYRRSDMSKGFSAAHQSANN